MNKRTEEILFFSAISILAVLGIVLGRKILKKPPVTNGGSNNNENTKLSNILFVGDSITAEYYKGLPTYTYSYIIKHKNLKGKTVDILAVVAKQTSWMLANLPAQLALRKYNRVYIYGGINDIFSGITATKAVSNIQKMVDMVVEHGAEAYVIIGYDTKKFTPDSKLQSTDYVTKDGMIKLRDKYIAYQKLLKNTITNATIIDEFQLNSSMNLDGIHPNATAHQIIAAILLKDIK